ncbi:MAG: hypothetical protein EXS13_00770 [Planctomycetes bacterium]|nr:hypothetical protein [Planctomycetota bacterium]
MPIVAVLADDQSAGFRTVEKLVYSVPEFAAFSHEVVLLAAIDGKQHASSKRIVDGIEVDWCTLFDCRCEEHRASHLKVRDQFAQREYWQPLHVFVSVDGVELTRAEGHEIDFDRLREELKRANQERTGAWWSYRDYRELLERLRVLLDQRSSRGGAAVHVELGKLVAAQKKAQSDPKLTQPLRTEAVVADVEELRAALIEEASGQVEDAAAAARIGGAVVTARRALLSIAREWKGFAPEKAAQSELAKLPAADGEKRKGG